MESVPAQAKPDYNDRCSFYLPRKRRHCKTIPGPGKRFCVEHSHLSGEDNLRKRIPCPLDPKHSCYEDQLYKHLKKCNFREQPTPDYYQKDMNAGSLLDADKEDDLKVTVLSCTFEELHALIKKVQKIYAELNLELEKEILFHKALKEEAEKAFNGPAAQKHILQQASLVGHVEHLDLLHDGTCFIEFGAGKGHMSHWIQQALSESSNSQFLLIERSGVRYKLDNQHKGEDQGPSFERLRMDIAHLNLGKVQSIQDKPRPVVGVGKHLCGAATDLTLRCLIETLPASGVTADQRPETKTKSDTDISNSTTEEETSGCRQHQSWAAGVVIALCCHHRCTWKNYVGKDWFLAQGLSGRDFHIITSMSSWATCATPFHESGEKATEEKNEDSEEPYYHTRYGNITPEEREEIGKQCKRLIDMGRIRYLEKNKLKSDLKIYIDSALSLENVVLLSTNKMK